MKGKYLMKGKFLFRKFRKNDTRQGKMRLKLRFTPACGSITIA